VSLMGWLDMAGNSAKWYDSCGGLDICSFRQRSEASRFIGSS
jgi:hypothetical protein